jgi:hypothetical protein
LEKLCTTTSRSSAARRPGSSAHRHWQRLEIQALVHLVGQDPGAGAPAMVQDGLLLARVSVQPVGLLGALTTSSRVAGVMAASSSGSPASRRPPPAAAHASDPWRPGSRLRRQVGPDRRDGDHLVARIHQRLHRQHQRVDAAGGHGNAVGATGRAARSCTRDRLAQLRQAQVVRVEGLAALQRLDGRLPDEGPASPRRSRQTRRPAHRSRPMPALATDSRITLRQHRSSRKNPNTRKRSPAPSSTTRARPRPLPSATAA